MSQQRFAALRQRLVDCERELSDIGRVGDWREQRAVLAHQVEDRRVIDAVA